MLAIECPTKQDLDIWQHESIALASECNGNTLRACATGAADSVDIVFGILRQVVVDHVTELSNALHEIMDGVTVHGFRSSFRQWVAEQTSFPESVCEFALGHVNSNRTEVAYQRSDLFDRRRELMQSWSDYFSGNNKVVSINQPRDSFDRRGEILRDS